MDPVMNRELVLEQMNLIEQELEGLAHPVAHTHAGVETALPDEDRTTDVNPAEAQIALKAVQVAQLTERGVSSGQGGTFRGIRPEATAVSVDEVAFVSRNPVFSIVQSRLRE